MSDKIKTVTPAMEYYNSRVLPGDEPHIDMISKQAIDLLRERFAVNFPNKHTVMTVYGTIFESILDVLKEAQATHEKCFIRIANRLLIGYSNNTDDAEAEKIGNFAPYMENLIRVNMDPNARTKDSLENEETEEAKERIPYSLCTEWMLQNKEDHFIMVCTKIAEKALKALSARKIALKYAIYIIPIFSTIQEVIIYYAMNYRDDNHLIEFPFNVLGYYSVRAYIDEELAVPRVSLVPIVEQKTITKSDKKASSKFE